MIPKVIHYCWFGGAAKPESVLYCIKSWKKYCPDYQIVEWNEENYPLKNVPNYVMQAYKAKKWAFMTDYVRLQIVYENGGIYMDTDVELKKSLDDLLCYDAYFGFEDGRNVNTGQGFGAKKNSMIIHDMMMDYHDISFVLPDGSFDLTPCPQRNTASLVKYGLSQDDTRQILMDNILILPSIYLCPKDYNTGLIKKSKKSYSIHHYDASWYSEEERARWKKNQKKSQFMEPIYRMRVLRYNVMNKILGKDGYRKLKKFLKKD